MICSYKKLILLLYALKTSCTHNVQHGFLSGGVVPSISVITLRGYITKQLFSSPYSLYLTEANNQLLDPTQLSRRCFSFLLLEWTWWSAGKSRTHMTRSSIQNYFLHLLLQTSKTVLWKQKLIINFKVSLLLCKKLVMKPERVLANSRSKHKSKTKFILKLCLMCSLLWYASDVLWQEILNICFWSLKEENLNPEENFTL